MDKYTCFICRKEKQLNGDMMAELEEGEVLLCPECSEVVERLTGMVGREIEIDG